MMLRLMLDIIHDCDLIRTADAERAVSFLSRERNSVLSNPSRRIGF
jgi:hypothetical protein